MPINNDEHPNKPEKQIRYPSPEKANLTTIIVDNGEFIFNPKHQIKITLKKDGEQIEYKAIRAFKKGFAKPVYFIVEKINGITIYNPINKNPEIDNTGLFKKEYKFDEFNQNL
ncbi:MAG: hypothetical protein ISS82_04840 [Nanoarchaeota archaeon]|nr:hypothetical protein [Nanoarchaeota archaeon]